MTDEKLTAETVAERVRQALDSADLEEFGTLLDPNVRWGAPGDANPPCQNRSQVLAWWGRGRESGTRARVSEVSVHQDKILVGVMVKNQGEYAERWQVMAVGPHGVTDIRGYEDRRTAVSHLGA